MDASVLYDGHNLTLAKSTGIGTYARTLAATAASIGFKAEILLGGNSGIDRKDPQLSEINLFDALTALQASPKLRVERYLAGLWGKPFGVKSAEFSRAGAVVKGVMSSLGWLRQDACRSRPV